MGKLKFAYAEIEYDGSGESILREIGQIFTRAMNSHVAAPGDSGAPQLGATTAPPLALPAAAEASPAESSTTRPRKKYSRRRKAATPDAAPAPSRQAASREEEPVLNPTRLSDRIAAAIDQRGPLTVTRLAQLLNASETGIRKSIGHSRGRFVMDDEERFSIA